MRGLLLLRSMTEMMSNTAYSTFKIIFALKNSWRCHLRDRSMPLTCSDVGQKTAVFDALYTSFIAKSCCENGEICLHKCTKTFNTATDKALYLTSDKP